MTGPSSRIDSLLAASDAASRLGDHDGAARYANLAYGLAYELADLASAKADRANKASFEAFEQHYRKGVAA